MHHEVQKTLSHYLCSQFINYACAQPGTGLGTWNPFINNTQSSILGIYMLNVQGQRAGAKAEPDFEQFFGCKRWYLRTTQGSTFQNLSVSVGEDLFLWGNRIQRESVQRSISLSLNFSHPVLRGSVSILPNEIYLSSYKAQWKESIFFQPSIYLPAASFCTTQCFLSFLIITVHQWQR